MGGGLLEFEDQVKFYLFCLEIGQNKKNLHSVQKFSTNWLKSFSLKAFIIVIWWNFTQGSFEKGPNLSQIAHISKRLYFNYYFVMFSTHVVWVRASKTGIERSARLSRRVETQLEEVAVVRSFVSFLLVLFCKGIGLKIRSPGHF